MSQLITLPEIKNFLSVKTANTEEDGRLSNIALQVSSLVSSYCGRDFLANTYTEYFDGGSASVFVANPPINAVYEVTHFDGNEYLVLGSPDVNGRPIVKEGAAHTISTSGTPILKTRVKKFGRSSLRLDGSSKLYVNSSEDWDLGVDDFTIELNIRLDSSTGSPTFISSGTTTDYWSFGIDFSNNILFYKVVANSVELANISSNTSTIVSNQFHHIGLTRKDGTFYLFNNGAILASEADTVAIPNYGTGLVIGNAVTGYIDSLGISHSAKYHTSYETYNMPIVTDSSTKLLMRFDGPNNSTTFVDLSRKVNEFAYYKSTGEITFDTGDGSGKPELKFFTPLKFKNYVQGVKVIYNGGFTTIPDDLKLAILEMVKVVYKGRSGSERVSFQGDSAQAHKLSVDDFPPQVRRVLNLYRLLN